MRSAKVESLLLRDGLAAAPEIVNPKFDLFGIVWDDLEAFAEHGISSRWMYVTLDSSDGSSIITIQVKDVPVQVLTDCSFAHRIVW